MADPSSPQHQDGGKLGQVASAASSPNHILQTVCEAPDLLVTSDDVMSEQGPALLPALVASTASPNSASLQPDYPVVAEIPSIQSCVVNNDDSEKTLGLNENLSVVTLDSQEGTLGKVLDSSELPPHMVSDSSRETTDPSVVAEALSDELAARVPSPAETPLTLKEVSVEKHAVVVPTSSEKLTVAGTVSNLMSSAVIAATEKPTVIITSSSDKSVVIADSSDLATVTAGASAGMSATVVSTLGEKSCVVTAAVSDELQSLVASVPEKTPACINSQLQESALVDIVSPKTCQTLETVQVEEPDQTKPSSHASEGELSLIDTGRKLTSLPIVSPDQSLALPSVLTHPLSSSLSSSSSLLSVSAVSSPVSSVNLDDRLQLPCSASSQDSVVEFSSTVMPTQEKGLAQVGSSSNGSQDPYKCLRAGNENQEHTKDKGDGCESNVQTNTTLNVEIEKEGYSCANSLLDNSSEFANSEQQLQIEEPGECWNDVDSSRETAVETLPLIVDTHTISQEDVDEENSVANPSSGVNNDFISPSVLSSSQMNTSNVNAVPLLESEPLQPVTIGSSLQPLEEVQEASMLDDPSFAADLALIDSSADEADSIGGLVINSVIGAADGVVDFHPEEEMETDRELTDISASAPQVVEESCDNVESSDETGPKAKRMRFENGINDDDRLQSSKKVIIKVLPVKNGHGLWDSRKLQQVLLAKGTILLRLHASTDISEMFEPDKNEKDVDFTGIMAETKDGDNDHILGLASLDPDADVYDPLAISATQSADHTSPHYSRPYPQSRGRSTALQPAMSRPGFRHLQSPPHPHYYTKHEVFGLPPPLEFEEPQLGTTDWSGMDIPIVASPEPQDPPDPPSAEATTSPSPKPVLVRKRVKKLDRVIRLKKVCEQCGKAFNKSHKYVQHLRTHRPLQQCDKCSFKTKDAKRFRIHEISHKKANPEVRCNICNELFATDVTLRIHKKKIHNIHVCKYCCRDFESEISLLDHMKVVHGHIREKKGYVNPGEAEYVKPINIFVDPPPANDKKQFVCRLCNKETRNKYQLKIHIAQHLGVSSSKISDDFLLTQYVDNLIREGGLGSSSCSSQEQNPESLFPVGSLENLDSLVKCELKIPSEVDSCQSLSSASNLDIPSAFASSPGRISASSVSTITKPLSDSYPSTSALPGIKQEPLETSSNDPESDVDHDEFSSFGDYAVFRCGLCALNFASPNDLYNHAVSVHQKSKETQPQKQKHLARRVKPCVPCDACTELFTSVKALRNHQRAKHRKIFTCPACHVSHKNINRLIRHQKLSHKDKIRCRFQCAALFDSEEQCETHYRNVHNKEYVKVICPYCKVEYHYEGNLINHLEKCKDCPPEKRPAHVCGNCDQLFPNIKEYSEHARNCGPQKKKNTEKTKSDSNVGTRMRKSTNDCGNINKLPKLETGVLRIEGNMITFKKDCTVKNNQIGMDSEGCSNKGEKGKSELSISVSNWKTEKAQSTRAKLSNFKVGPQKCKYCPGKFTDKEDAVNHILAVHKNLITRMITEPQMCEVCGMIFKNQLCLCKHISKHYSDLGMWDVLVPRDLLDIVKVRSYCWVCKSTLRGKMKHHTNMRNNNIDRILAAEGKELKETEPFLCSKCNDFYPTRTGYWKHMKEHISNLPKWSHQLNGPSSSDNFANKEADSSECSECSLKFVDKSELYRHLAIHFIEPYTHHEDKSESSSDEEWNPYEHNNKRKRKNKATVTDDEVEDDDAD